MSSVSAITLTGNESSWAFTVTNIPQGSADVTLFSTDTGSLAYYQGWDVEPYWIYFYNDNIGNQYWYGGWSDPISVGSHDVKLQWDDSEKVLNFYIDGVLMDYYGDYSDVVKPLLSGEVVLSQYVSDFMVPSPGPVDEMFNSAFVGNYAQNISPVFVGGSLIGLLFASYSVVKRFL